MAPGWPLFHCLFGPYLPPDSSPRVAVIKPPVWPIRHTIDAPTGQLRGQRRANPSNPYLTPFRPLSNPHRSTTWSKAGKSSPPSSPSLARRPSCPDTCPRATSGKCEPYLTLSEPYLAPIRTLLDPYSNPTWPLLPRPLLPLVTSSFFVSFFIILQYQSLIV